MVIDSREMMKQAREEFALALNAQRKQILYMCGNRMCCRRFPLIFMRE